MNCTHPDSEVTMFDGMVEFWCPDCRMHMLTHPSQYEAYAMKPEVVMIFTVDGAFIGKKGTPFIPNEKARFAVSRDTAANAIRARRRRFSSTQPQGSDTLNQNRG